jgi:hypothetical protein
MSGNCKDCKVTPEDAINHLSLLPNRKDDPFSKIDYNKEGEIIVKSLQNLCFQALMVNNLSVTLALKKLPKKLKIILEEKCKALLGYIRVAWDSGKCYGCKEGAPPEMLDNNGKCVVCEKVKRTALVYDQVKIGLKNFNLMHFTKKIVFLGQKRVNYSGIGRGTRYIKDYKLPVN